MSRRFSANFVTASGISLSGLNITLAGWVYHEADGSIGGDVLYMDEAGGLGANGIGIFTVNGNLNFFANGSILYSQAIATGGWTHVAATRDGTTQRAYVNGVLVNSSTSWTTATFNHADCGSFGDNTNTLQDLCIFSVGLSAVEIQQLMNRRVPNAQLASLYAWWPMFGDSGTIDWSGHGHTWSGAGDSIGVVNAPAAWSGPAPVYALRVAGGATNITSSGVTNVTGAAAVTSAAALVASGTTNVTGAAAVTKSASAAASGTTQVTGAATITKSAAIVATGTTQVTGAADLPSGLLYGFISSSIMGFSAWVYPRSNVAASDVFWVPLFASGVNVGAFRIAVNGTTLRFETTNTADASSALYQQSISLNAWTHVSYQIDRSGSPIRARAYVNGVELDASAIDLTSVDSAGRPIIGKNADMTIRDADISTLSASQVAGAYALRNALLTGKSPSYAYFPLLSGGAHLNAYDSVDTLSVLGNVVEGGENPPAPWGGPNTLQYLSASAVNIAITATGLTQVSGSAAVSSAAPIVAAGATQVTGAAVITAAAPVAATGVTQVTGAAAVTASAALVAAGVTQVSGAAALSATAPLVAAGLTQVTGASNLTTPGDVASTGLTQVTGAANVSIAYSITAAGVTQVTGSAAFTGAAPPSSPGGDTLMSRRFLHTVGRRHVR